MQMSSESSYMSVASRVPWEQFCKMLDKVSMAKAEAKKLMLTKFINNYRELLKNNKDKNPNSTDTFFPVMRTLLPALDRDRGAYGVKEHKLAELYIRVLGLRKDSVDAQKLLNYRKPKSGGSSVGDFADVAFYVLKSRCPLKGDLSLQDVDAYLTSMAENYAAKNHDKVEQSILIMLRKMSAGEQMWLLRVLLKDLHLGLGQTSIFKAWHPDAKDLYDVTNNIAKVCSTLVDPNVRLHEVEVSLFAPFRPMLAERVILDKVETQMKDRSFYVEVKYDGERSQIHKKGDKYMYFSRNGFDFSSNFGPNPNCGLFTPFLHPLFQPHVREIILDGEIIGYSKKHQSLITKAQNMDVKNLREDGDWQVCFCAFDILYLNGKVLSNLPLTERIVQLASALKPMEGRCIITDRSRVKSKDDVIQVLNAAIDNRDEGVVLKDPDSVYQPASRKAGWIKVKPEYVDSLVPELDLVIIGGYYGTGRQKGKVSHFLLAIAKKDNENKDSRPSIFQSFCRVGSGYTASELEGLMAKISPNLSTRKPSNVEITKEKPAVWIDPRKSTVVQVKAAEIIISDKYKTGVTLRFPRVEAIRTDKDCFEILNNEELEELKKEASGKLASKHLLEGASSKESQPKRRMLRHSVQPSLPKYFCPADVSKVVKVDDMFRGKEFCVIGDGIEHSKHEIEVSLVEHGGTFSQHPGTKTFCLICDNLNVRVKNLIASGLYNVIMSSWIFESIEAQCLANFRPSNILFLKKDERKIMEENFDNFGDSFTKSINEAQLQHLMKGMKKEDYRTATVDEMREIEEVIDLGQNSSVFRGITALVSSSLISLKLRVHGANVTEKMDENVTHVICDSSRQYVPSEYPGRHLVNFEWIDECIGKGCIVADKWG